MCLVTMATIGLLMKFVHAGDSTCQYRRWFLSLALFIGVFVLILINLVPIPTWNVSDRFVRSGDPSAGDDKVGRYLKHFQQFNQFDEFDNETGSMHFLVPNIIHYVRFNQTKFNFIDYICLRSAYMNQRPDFIFVHTNVQSFRGSYWRRIQNETGLRKLIRIIPAQIPSQIFNQSISESWRLHHGSDISRLHIIQKFGGIYLDNDVYVVRNLDRYRRFEAVIGWPPNQFLGNQIIIANNNARVLPLWMDTYKEYKKHLWYYNGGERPTVQVLDKLPHLVHRVGLKLGVHMLAHNLYSTMWNEWRDQDAIHLLYNHRSYLDPHYNCTKDFNETNVDVHPHVTIRTMILAALVPFVSAMCDS